MSHNFHLVAPGALISFQEFIMPQHTPLHTSMACWVRQHVNSRKWKLKGREERKVEYQLQQLEPGYMPAAHHQPLTDCTSAAFSETLQRCSLLVN